MYLSLTLLIIYTMVSPDPYTEDHDLWGNAPVIAQAQDQQIPIQNAEFVDLYPEELFSNAVKLGLQASFSAYALKDSLPQASSDLKNQSSGKDAASFHHDIPAVKMASPSTTTHRHLGKELPWGLQWLDSLVESIIVDIDSELGNGKGLKVKTI